MFYAATEAETIRPMLDVAWAPMLGAFSVVFEQFHTGPSLEPYWLGQRQASQPDVRGSTSMQSALQPELLA